MRLPLRITRDAGPVCAFTLSVFLRFACLRDVYHGAHQQALIRTIAPGGDPTLSPRHLPAISRPEFAK
jgi:hypothetical protein